jgi:antitoxin (DNA-binding transcriptional repressor) of toxin-antitoxin stability system
MQTVSLFEAKTHLSRIVEGLVTGKEDRVVISRRGKPVVCVTSLRKANTSKRIGLARGRFIVPDNIDGANAAVAKLFKTGGRRA